MNLYSSYIINFHGLWFRHQSESCLGKYSDLGRPAKRCLHCTFYYMWLDSSPLEFVARSFMSMWYGKSLPVHIINSLCCICIYAVIDHRGIGFSVFGQIIKSILNFSAVERLRIPSGLVTIESYML